jgi:hypothetical protein
MKPEPVSNEGLDRGYSTRETNMRVVAWLVVAFVVAGILSHIVIAVFYAYLKGDRPGGTRQSLFTQPTQWDAKLADRFPEPRLEVSPPANLAQVRAREKLELEGYAWIDRSAGQVRIPVVRAMQLLAERGLPVLDGSSNDFGKSSYELLLERTNAMPGSSSTFRTEPNP